MLPLIAFILFVTGFYLLYNTSKRAEVPGSALKKWVSKNPLPFKWISLVLLISSFALFMYHYGIGAGFFIAIVLLMALSGLVILLVPVFKPNK